MFILAYEFEATVAGFMVRLIITISSQPVLDLQFIIIIIVIIIIILTALDPGTFFHKPVAHSLPKYTCELAN